MKADHASYQRVQSQEYIPQSAGERKHSLEMYQKVRIFPQLGSSATLLESGSDRSLYKLLFCHRFG